MISETARVVAVSDDALWIEARRGSRCRGCAARGACGHRLLDSLARSASSGAIRVPAAGFAPLREARVGDLVSVGIPESLVLRLSLVFYILPLAALITAALLAEFSGAGEAVTIACGLSGLALGFAALRHYGHRARAAQWQPEPLALHSQVDETETP